jgi:hypothetical protein
MLREVPFNELIPGMYTVNEMDTDNLPTHFAEFLTVFEERVNEQVEIYEETKDAKDPKGLGDPTAFVHVTEWQDDLKQVTMYLTWTTRRRHHQRVQARILPARRPAALTDEEISINGKP